MTRDHQDALMDQLLREILGGDRPRDMTARVVAQAKIYDRFRRRWWISAGSAMAASVAIAVSLAMFWPHSHKVEYYPEPSIESAYLTNGSNVQVGSHIETDDTNPGSLQLGDYVNVIMQPQTALTLGGTQYQEKVFLEQGEVAVSVVKNKGKFDVAVGSATVHVTGTKFNVNVMNEETATAQTKKLLVRVTEGSVVVDGVPGQNPSQKLAAGDEKEFVISSQPKFIPPVNSALRAGLPAAAQEGARIGNRSGVGGRLLIEPFKPAAAQSRPAARGAVAPVIAKPVQLILTVGSAARNGRLHREHDIFYVEAPDGNFFMFPQTPLPNSKWAQALELQYVHVVWTEGKVTDVGPVPSTTTQK